MRSRGLVDKKGELFAYLEGNTLYTLEGEVTGRFDGEFIVDMAGNRVWRVLGDGVYTLKSAEPVGYFSGQTPGES